MSSNVSSLWRHAAANKLNLFYSLSIIFNHFAYGIGVTILSVTLVDLRFVYGVSFDQISYVEMAPGAGVVVGAAAGWLYKWVNRQLSLIVFVVIAGIAIWLVPFYPNYPVALFGIAWHGIGGGAWYSASGYWMVEMWPEGNAVMLQVMEFMFGAGTVVAPLLVAPYVWGEETEEGNRTITAQDRVDALSLPYAIAGALQLVVPILWTLLFFTHRYKNTVNVVEEAQIEDCESNKSDISKPDLETKVQPEEQHSHIPFRKAKLLLAGLAISTYASCEMGWFGFSTSLYQYLEINLDAETADHIYAILASSYTLGRLATAVISLWVIPDIIIGYHYAVIVASFAGLVIGQHSYTCIIISTIGLGFGFSAMWPGVLAFVERHLGLSDRVCSIYSTLSGVGSLITPLVMSMTFKRHPEMLFFVVGGWIASSVSLFSLVCCWIYLDSYRQVQKR